MPKVFLVTKLPCAVVVLSVTLSLVAVAAPAHARVGNTEELEDSSAENQHGDGAFAVDREPDRPRSDIGIPILSLFLPGFDQWWEGQYTYALAYSGTAILGYSYADHTAREDGLWEKKRRAQAERDAGLRNPDDDERDKILEQKGIAERKFTLGFLAAQGAGGLSAYHAFRTSVRTRQASGQYDFLDAEETPVELLTAPFRFSYLKRSTTLIPLAVIAALSAYTISADLPANSEVERTAFTQADAAFTSAFSYNAGVHEEAVFRGWMMPVMREYWDSSLWANVAQAGIFALAHLNNNPRPLAQLLLGYHLGYVTQEDGWRLGEAIFIHAWWDVLAFATQYHYKQKEPQDQNSQKAWLRPVLWLPPLQFAF